MQASRRVRSAPSYPNSHRLLYWMRKRRDKLGDKLGAPSSDLRQQEVSLHS